MSDNRSNPNVSVSPELAAAIAALGTLPGMHAPKRRCWYYPLLCAVAVVLSVFLALLEGWVFIKFWSWFIIPTFGAPEIGLIPAAGAWILVSVMTVHLSCVSRKVGTLAEAFTIVVEEAVVVLLALLCGWSLHLLA